MADPVVGPGGAAFGIYPSAGRRTVRPRVGLLDRTYTGEPAQPDLAPRVRPQPEPPPAEMREYQPTMRESAAARTQEALQGLGVERAGARRMAQTVLGGPSSNLPLGVGLVDLPLLPSIPFLAEEGYRGTERAMSAAQRGDYGTAAMEYLGAATMLAPGVAVAPAVAREVKNVVGKAAADAMGVGSRTRQSQRGIFLAPKFFTAQEKARISTAERLEREGTSPDEVLVQTGLLRDLDGTWSVEISDDKMKFKALEAVKKARQAVTTRIEDIEAAQYLRTAMDAGSSMEDATAAYRTAMGRAPSAKATQFASTETLKDLEEAAVDATNSLMAPIRGLKLKDVIEHPELFDRIPALAEMQVDFLATKKMGADAGQFTPSEKGTGTIGIRAQYLRPEEDYGRSITAHEVQHAVDDEAGKDFGVSPTIIKEARDYWGTVVKDETINFNADATAFQARRLMDANPGMTPEQALDEVVSKGNHYGTAEDFGGPGTIDPNTQDLFTKEGMLRDVTLRIIRNVPSDALNQRVDDSQRRLREAFDKRNAAAPTEAGREEQYMLNQGEARARLAQTRLDLTPEERRDIFPMREQFMGLDRPRKDLRTASELTGGRFGPTSVSAAPAAMRQRGAVDLGPRPVPLSEALADQPTTLRVLENLPGKRTTVTEQELREQMRRPEVTKAEKDVLERVISRMVGGSMRAQQLVKEVGLETAPYRLEPVESDQFTEYGLSSINRTSGDYSYDSMRRENANMQNPRTTIYRSPTETSADNHFEDPNYFGHTRAFEADGIPHVVELQSDLVQKGDTALSPEDRFRLERGNVALDVQRNIIKDMQESKVGSFSDMADNIERNLPALEAANEDFKLIFGSRLKEYPTFSVSWLGETDAVDLGIRMLRNEHGEENQRGAADAMSRALARFSDDLNVRKAENNAKLAERGAAEAQRPMFKNWERRLIREELSRAATPQPSAEYTRLRNETKAAIRQLKEAENYYESNGLSDREIASLTKTLREDALQYAKTAEETPRYQPIPSVVRFADADTVAKIEGWQEVNVSERDRLRYAVEAQRRTVVDEERLVEAAKARGADEDTMIRRESSMGHARAVLAMLKAELERAGGDSTGRFYKQHQGIYDRYNKEVANYLKSLGGKQVKDEHGVGWWEVPVKPQQRRTQIFSMGGGTVAAGGTAAYNAATPVEED